MKGEKTDSTTRHAVISLLTDFGGRDGYVGIMKGVILAINPLVALVDLSHEIDPGDIDSAAFVLARSYRYFPPGTIHVVVVDPGVGSGRRILAVESKNYYFIAPDNGVLKWIFANDPGAHVISVTRKEYFLANVSNTFHGRDIFAPVAAHLAQGVPLANFGDPIDDYDKGNIHKPLKSGNKVTGSVIYIDRFGNLITNIAADEIAGKNKIARISIAGHAVARIADSYSQVQPGEILALIGSHGNLEIAQRDGSAAAKLNISVGTPVTVHFTES